MKWVTVTVLYVGYCVTVYVFTWRYETTGAAAWRLLWVAVPAAVIIWMVVFRAVTRHMKRKAQ